jgi:hypothetical protein
MWRPAIASRSPHPAAADSASCADSAELYRYTTRCVAHKNHAQDPDFSQGKRLNGIRALSGEQQNAAGTGNALCQAAFNCVRLVAFKEAALEGPMVRELELLAVTVVFMFLGACVMGVVH